MVMFSASQFAGVGVLFGLAYVFVWRDLIQILDAQHGADAVAADAVRVWTIRLGLAAMVAWLIGLAYPLYFARSFVRPMHAMRDFSRKLAAGALHERLVIDVPRELVDLRDFLNGMASNLDEREHERKQAAERVEALHQELLSASRLAGMAEVASGVLHNVGNVLNSLNVSISVVGEQVKHSKVRALEKTIALYDDYPGGLPKFLETEKGQILPAYLASVSRRLTEENEQLALELAAVSTDVEHMKTIVSTQQSFARLTELHEPLEVAELLDDALRLGELSFARHGIEVVRDYEPLPSVVADRHKLLQILINLVSNARHALIESSTERPRLQVRLRRIATGIRVEVADNGVGIAAEHAAKIFQYGFTTKKGGHGLGLHSSASAVRDLGGTLNATSEGRGYGATFSLELPFEAPRACGTASSSTGCREAGLDDNN